MNTIDIHLMQSSIDQLQNMFRSALYVIHNAYVVMLNNLKVETNMKLI